MEETVFSVNTIKGLKDGVNSMFEIFVRIGDLHYQDSYKITTVMDKLKRVSDGQWQDIRDKFLPEKADGNKDTHSGMTEPARLILDFTNQLEAVRSCLQKHMAEWYKNDEVRKSETKKVQDQLTEVQGELADVRWRYKKDSAGLTAALATNERLEEVIKEKTQKIAELSRNSTVQLWEKEKTRILESEAVRTTELQLSLDRAKQENTTLNKKLQELESKFKLQKMKNDLQLKPTENEAGAEIDTLQKYIHYLEQDLRSMETTLHSQMKYTIGVLNGLKTEYWQLFKGILSGEEAEEKIDSGKIEGIKKLHNTMETCHIASRHGKLNSLRADLKDSFVSTDKDVVSIPVRKLSTAFNIHSKGGGKPPGGAPSPPNARRLPNGLQSTSPDSTTSPGNGPLRRKTTITNAIPPVIEEPPENDHPVLVSATGHVNMIRVLQNFPHMTKEYVQEQWHHFKMYDSDGNGTLDLTEMMAAMSSTLGQQFTAAQVKDAMLEVDADGSSTIDFFEYLSVADMLFHKHGRSEVFRSKMIQQQARTMSKTCSIQ